MRQREGFHWFRRWRPSGRQRRVLDALLQGRSNADIAVNLGISLDGAKWHVTQLLTETGLEDRAQLAEWWQGEREAVAVRPLGALFGLFARLAFAGSVVGVAVWLLVADSHKSGTSDEKARASLPATASAPVTAIPAPTPSPTPQPPGAWIFDVRARTVEALPPANAYQQWIDAERFITYAGPQPVVTDREGHVLTRLPAGVGPVYAQPGRAGVLAWDGHTNRLYEISPDDSTTTTLLELEPAPQGKPNDASRQLAISPISRMLAVADPGDPSTSVSVTRLDGSALQTIWSSDTGVSVETLSWSPDGTKLLLLTSVRTLQGVRPITTLRDAIVIDGRGRELLRRPATDYGVSWLGSGQILIAQAGQNGQERGSQVANLTTGKTAEGPSLAGFFCASPDGRLAVYGEPTRSSSLGRAAKHLVVDLQTGAIVLEAQTRPEIGSCEWTADGTKVVLSPGGK